MLLCLCGQRLVTQQLYHLQLLLWQLSLPSPPPFTTLSSTWLSSPIFASPCVEMWRIAEGDSVDVCARVALQRREFAGSPITKKNATLQGYPMGYQRTTGPADTVLAQKQTTVIEKIVQTTVLSKPPGFFKDPYTVKWLSASSPMRCRVTFSRGTSGK